MARYGQRNKDRIVARLLPPESSAIDLVSREVGISVATLERWRADALANGSAAGSPRWTAAARLQAVIAMMRGIDLEAEKAAALLPGGDKGRAGTGEVVEHQALRKPVHHQALRSHQR